MADYGGNETRPSGYPYAAGRLDEPGARGDGDRAVAENRILETKRLKPVIPAERVSEYGGSFPRWNDLLR